jgi:hypothetical protein
MDGTIYHSVQILILTQHWVALRLLLNGKDFFAKSGGRRIFLIDIYF